MGYVQLSVYGYIYFKESEFVILLRAVKKIPGKQLRKGGFALAHISGYEHHSKESMAAES